MNLPSSTYTPLIDCLCQYCGADFTQADITNDADPIAFEKSVRTVATLLDAWMLTLPSVGQSMAYASQFARHANYITRATPTIANKLRGDFFIDNAKTIKAMRKVGKKLRTDYHPQQLIAMPDSATTETRLLVTQLWMGLPKLLAVIADCIDEVVDATAMPDDPYKPAIELWAPRFRQLLDSTISQRARLMEGFIAQAMKAMNLSRQQAINNHYAHEHEALDKTTLGKEFLNDGITRLDKFVTELRRFSVVGKGLKSFRLDELVVHIADFLWAKQAQEEIATTININHVDTLNINDIHDNNNVKA